MPTSLADPPRKSASLAANNKYLQHLQSKNDPRQTIAAAPIVRTVSHQSSSSSSSSQSNGPSTTTTTPGASTASTSARPWPTTPVDVTMPTTRSTVPSYSTTHHETRKPRRSKDKPPLGHKHPRSIISILTNTTYLSSDSEGEDDTSTATATVHSDGTSLGSIGRRRKHRRSTGDDSRSAGTSPSFPPEEAGRALIPFAARPDDVEDHHHQNRNQYFSSSYTTNSQSYEDEDEQQQHIEQDAFSYSSGDDEEDDTLNQLIAETSARWKMAVHETVQSTTTSAAFSSSSHMVSSSVLQMQYASSPGAADVGPLVPSPSSGDLSNRSADAGFPVAAPSTSSQLIQEQQAEIEALRAALQRHHTAAPSPAPPVHPIQILTVPPDPHGVEDDLTVWSGFHSTAPPPQQRPDAESADHCKSSSGPLKLPRAARLPPPTTSLRLELSSPVTGLQRAAVFTGTITSRQPPVDASFTTRANHFVTGTGVLQFLETGDVYRGELVHSELHGVGTYTFAQSQSRPLSGRFAHNVFMAE
jgi:hypothetical protein